MAIYNFRKSHNKFRFGMHSLKLLLTQAFLHVVKVICQKKKQKVCQNNAKMTYFLLLII